MSDLANGTIALFYKSYKTNKIAQNLEVLWYTEFEDLLNDYLLQDFLGVCKWVYLSLQKK